MPPKPHTARSVRSALTALAKLSEASLAAVQYRWDASGLAYDPLAGLAENPADRYNRLLKSKVDRMVDPGAEPGESELPRQPAQPDPIRAGRRPPASAGRKTPLRPAKAAAVAGARPQRPGRKSGHRPLPVDPTAVSSGSAPDFTVDDSAVTGILGRHATPFGGQDSTGLPAPGNKFDVPQGERSRMTQPAGGPAIPAAANPVVHFDERVAADPARQQASEAIESGPGPESGILNPSTVPPKPRRGHHRLPDQVGAGDPVLGNTPLSSRGMKTPIALDPAVSAGRLSAWAEPAGRIDAPPAPLRSPRPDETRPTVGQPESANRETGRNLAGTAEAPTQRPGAVLPELSAGFSNLERLVHRWQADQKEAPRPEPAALQPASGPDLTRMSAGGSLYSDRLPAPESSPASASDADFARRLENVLLRESRRHGIVLEDQ